MSNKEFVDKLIEELNELFEHAESGIEFKYNVENNELEESNSIKFFTEKDCIKFNTITIVSDKSKDMEFLFERLSDMLLRFILLARTTSDDSPVRIISIKDLYEKYITKNEDSENRK